MLIGRSFITFFLLFALLIGNITNVRAANSWAPILVLDNGDQVLWRMISERDKNGFMAIEEKRELMKKKGKIKSYITRLDIDCDRARIQEVSYDYFSDIDAKEFIEKRVIQTGQRRWAHAEFNEYVYFMTNYFCFDD